MITIENKANCCGCHACFNICPNKAINMVEDDNGFKIPVIDKAKCIDCGLCEKVCPILNNNISTNEPIAYAVSNLNEDERKNSSSGGVFSLLAKYILNKNGIVFGACFDEKFNVKHTYIETEEELKKFRSSKYVQSTIGDTFKQVKSFLEKNRLVLFSGTPCQIEGLKKFLMKDYENLYTQDIICHGVPSPKVWQDYVRYRENKANQKTEAVNFRNKDDGWGKYNTYFKFENGEYKIDHNKDPFMNVFLSDLVLRESCYECKFKKKNRISDITLGDFWGIDKINKEFNDDTGVSLVILNSKKAIDFFEEIKEKTKYEKVDFEQAISYNKSMTNSAKYNNKRDIVLKKINENNFEKLANKYKNKISLYRKIKRRIKKIIVKK